MALPDRSIRFILEDVLVKGVVVSYAIQSPTKNRKAAIEKMLEAGEFITKHGESMDQDSFDRIGELSMKLVKSQRTVSTGWRDLFSHPIYTYKHARDFKHNAEDLLSVAKSASTRSRVNQVGEARVARADQRAARQTQVDALVQVPAPQDDGIVPEHPANVTAPATLFPLVPPIPAPQDDTVVPMNPVIVSPPVTPFPSAPPIPAPQDGAIVPTHPVIITPQATHPALAPPHTDLQTVVDDFVYIRIGKVEMKGPLDSGTRLNFDGKCLTTSFCLRPNDPPESEPLDPATGEDCQANHIGFHSHWFCTTRPTTRRFRRRSKSEPR